MTFSIVGCEDDLETGNNGSINGHDYVDLGLPSGTKWATCNVGATIPEEYGNYYAWDESSTKWGGSWRMPTKEEMEELMQNCIWKWTTQNNADGYKVIGSNGNSIFLPATKNGNERGHYWTSSPVPFTVGGDNYDAYHLEIESNNRGVYSNGVRYYGFTVRPISD